MPTFDDYKKMAQDGTLLPYEKVGFGREHRAGTEENIFPDIEQKLDLKNATGTFLDIGCGCSKPTLDTIDFCKENDLKLILIDSAEMLDNLPDGDYIKMPCEFPKCEEFLEEYRNSIENIVTYSVLHSVFPFVNIFTFLDSALSLLTHGGSLLIGDVANISKKKRFLSSDEGIEFHKKWSGSNKTPEITWNFLESHEVDDSVVFSILQRYRAMGFETYLLPQKDGLPMNKTREDILIVKN